VSLLLDTVGPQPPREDEAPWQPELFDAVDPMRLEALGALLRSGRVRTVHDAIDDQLWELSETRLPRPDQAERRAGLIEELLAGRPSERFGCWVYFPWRSSVVHLLPEAEFRELRTSRNRNKITEAEQQRLRTLRIGIAGLSVGLASAVTLALEEIGGEYRLADFDSLALSNLNRLRASVEDLGTNKAVLGARAIFELNPYARVRVFDEGVTDENLDAFFEGGGQLDLLIEECDDLYMKVRLREQARALRIPVLMETSDRGLIDVERFDREPRRPLLHGLIGEVRADALRALPTVDKVPFVLDILGTSSLSSRFAGSLYEIDRTLRSWPQLASGVALGGALNADAARRIVLGGLRDSGRFYVDLEQLVADGRAQPSEQTPPLPALETPAPALPRSLSEASLGEAQMRELVQIACLAPSGGNMQPWRFVAQAGRVELRLAEGEARSLLDHRQRASVLALGAAAENLRLAAPHFGLAAQLVPFPAPEDPLLVAEVTLRREPTAAVELPLEAVLARATNRRLARPQEITVAQREAIFSSARRSGVGVELLTPCAELDELADILGEGDRLRFLNDGLRREMGGEVLFTEQAVRRGLGMDVRSLELNATDLAGLRLALSGAGMKLEQALGLGRVFEEGAHKALAQCSGMLLMTVEGEEPRAFFEGGRALENLWISAQAAGLAVQPYAALLYLFLRLEDADDAGGIFSTQELEQLRALKERFRRVLPLPAGHTDVMLLRLAHAGAPTVRALRRPLDEVFSFR
jgi:nitroreductase